MQRMWMLGCLALAGMSPAFAQEAAVSQLYGLGLHSYYAGDTTNAEQYLTGAIDAGMQDPRAYYFRGLTFLRSGRSFEAEADFTRGAEIEGAKAEQFGSVSKALERVQGHERMMLEKHRARGRLLAYEQREEMRSRRYQGIVGPRRTRDATPSAEPPADDVAPTPPPAVKPPVAPRHVPRDADPIEVEPSPAAPANMPAEDDPFGADEPAAPAAPTDAAPADDMPAEDDPFGDAPAAEEAPAMPAEEPLPPADDAPAADDAADPFGDAPVDDAAMPADEPAGEASDPFGDAPADDAAPPAEAADDDPFATP